MLLLFYRYCGDGMQGTIEDEREFLEVVEMERILPKCERINRKLLWSGFLCFEFLRVERDKLGVVR